MSHVKNADLAAKINAAAIIRKHIFLNEILEKVDPASDWQTDLGLEINIMWGTEGLAVFDLYLDPRVCDECRKVLHRLLTEAGKQVYNMRIKTGDEQVDATMAYHDVLHDMRHTAKVFALIIEKDIYHVQKDNVFAQWRQQEGKWAFIGVEAMKTGHTELLGDKRSYITFLMGLERLGRKKVLMTYTFSPQNYGADMLNLMKHDNKVEPIFGQEHHRLFDYLMAALSDQRQDEKEHIERVVAFKWAFPACYDLPGLVFSGAGNCGKSLFGEKLVPFILTGRKGGKLTSQMLLGQFNGEMMGSACYFFDEVMNSPDCTRKLKAWTQTSTIQIHAKGMTPFDVDATGLFVFAGNTDKNPNLCVVALDGDGATGADRRWSVFKTHRTMPNIVAEAEGFTLPSGGLDDLKGGAADQWIKRESKRVIEDDPEELGRWLGNMLVKYQIADDQGTLLVDQHQAPGCFHGEDYEFFVDGQNGVLKEVLNQLFVVDRVAFIGVIPLYNIFKAHYRNSGGDQKFIQKRNTVEVEVEKYLAARGLGYSTLGSHHITKQEAFGPATKTKAVGWRLNGATWPKCAAENYFEYPDKLRDDAIQPIVRGARVAVTPRLIAVGGTVVPSTTLADKIKFHQETNRNLQPVAPAAEPAPMSKLAAMQAAHKASKAADL